MRSPFRPLDVLFDLLSMCAAVYEDFFDAGVGEKLEGVFDERGVGEGQQALRGVRTAAMMFVGIQTLGRSSVKGLKRVSKGSASI